MILEPWCASLPEPLAREVLRAPERHVLFVDIETEGLSKERNGLTVLGTMVGRCYRAFVAGHNLEQGPEYLARFPVWVTFGGSTFDLPFLRAHFPDLSSPLLHIDLCRVFRRLGYRGGLKQLERRFGLSRKTRGFTGYDAVKLWQRWREKKDRRALRLLLQYNREDVANLRPLLEIAAELSQEAGLG